MIIFHDKSHISLMILFAVYLLATHCQLTLKYTWHIDEGKLLDAWLHVGQYCWWWLSTLNTRPLSILTQNKYCSSPVGQIVPFNENTIAIENSFWLKLPGCCLKIKMLSYQYRNYHYEDNTVRWLSYIFIWISIPRKTVFTEMGFWLFNG